MLQTIIDEIETERAKKTFYPTPESLAYELVSSYDWKFIQSVLEPSAGKGDLALMAAKKQYSILKGYSVHNEQSRKEAIRLADVDCIEIDPVLRATHGE